jgi:cell division protein ZapE
MLMDLFTEHLAITAKRRVHFHAFMQEIHHGMHAARKTRGGGCAGPGGRQRWRRTRLLAFDEMQITDITDAMIVGRLFEKLFAAGVVIVTTSNRPPEDLYKNGLNRALFLPFIAMLNAGCRSWNWKARPITASTGWQGAQVYFHPAGAAPAEIGAIWDRPDRRRGRGRR